MLSPALAPLAAWPQFILWRIEIVEGKPTKVPYHPRGFKASSTDPSQWVTYEEAYQAVAGFDGIGFVLSANDPFWFLDIDKALQPAGWSVLAQELCARLSGAAVEVSQSGTGLHIIGTGTPPENHGNRNIPLHLEFYSKERFIALTDRQTHGSVSAQPEGLADVCAQFFTRATADKAAEWTTTACAEWIGPEDDGELIARALRSKSNSAAAAFSDDAVTFEDLFCANADALAKRWPPDASGYYNASSADVALANSLAFWTGRNCERIERIMRMSALARPKWDERPNYLADTILKAAGFVKNVYQEKAPPPPPPTAEQLEAVGMDARLDGGIMLYHQQLEHFAGCIYIQSINRILTPTGDLLDQARFNVVYGGYSFVHQADGSRPTSSAWTAYTENQSFRPVMADRLCFRPEMGDGGIVVDAGKRLANTYRTVPHDDLEGDASPFLNHMQKMFPVGDDFTILISYMASVVQNPGMKAQWWPVVQGAQGNFKSFLLLIMQHAVGTHYTHMPNMEKMVRGGSNFNGWIDRKLFLGLDEVYAANRREFFEGFKTTVTNRFLPVEAKGVDETTNDNRANGMIVTNHKDGVPITGKDRRFAVFFAAQQTQEDMLLHNMNPAYISDLKDWLLGMGAYAQHGPNYGIRIMAGHLRSRAIEAQYDPNRLSIKCPETSSTKAALTAGLGMAEQAVKEAIEEDRQGFAGGWVSSVFLDRLLDMRKIRVAYTKRRELMQTLGFDYHPALGDDGRVNNPIMPDNTKPRLYIRVGHISANLTTAAEAAKAYTKAQEKAMSGEAAAAFG